MWRAPADVVELGRCAAKERIHGEEVGKSEVRDMHVVALTSPFGGRVVIAKDRRLGDDAEPSESGEGDEVHSMAVVGTVLPARIGPGGVEVTDAMMSKAIGVAASTQNVLADDLGLGVEAQRCGRRGFAHGRIFGVPYDRAAGREHDWYRRRRREVGQGDQPTDVDRQKWAGSLADNAGSVAAAKWMARLRLPMEEDLA